MITTWRLAICVLLVIGLNGLLTAQSARRQPQQPQGGPAPAARPGAQPPGPALGGQLPRGGFGTRVLKGRELVNRDLEEKDLKKYESLVNAMQKRAEVVARNAQTNRTAELSAALRLASTHLRYGQEQAAKDEYAKAWQMVPEMYGESRTAAAATGQVRGHLREMQTMAANDPELVLTLMSDLSEAHRRAYDAIEQDRAKGQLSQPLAQAWAQLTQMGQLDEDALGEASKWILLHPQTAMVDRPLPPEAVANYQSELTQINVDITPRLRQLAERQLARATGRAPQAFNPGSVQDIDPATAQIMSILDAKRGPLMRFMEADVHLRFGQSRDGLAATQAAWRELLEFYRSNPGAVSPVDAELHFETLARMADLNPIQAAVVVDQVDPAYRTMLQADRTFGVRVADLWAKSASELVLPAPMLGKAGDWLEHVSKQHKDLEAKYAPALEEVRSKLPEQEAKPVGQERNAHNTQDAGQEDEPLRSRTRRGITVPQGVDHLREANQ